MKKITFLLFIIINAYTGYSQCIFNTKSPSTTIVSNNSATVQNISSFAFAKNYAEISNLIIGGKYTFNCKANGITNGYITITDLNNTVIATGNSPLIVENIPSDIIRMNYSENADCSTNFSTLTLSFQFVLPTCPSSTNLIAYNITTTEATFEWTPGTDVTEWEVLVLKKGSPAPTSSTQGIAVSYTPTYTNTDLEASTLYQFYIRSICGSDLGLWIKLDFASECLPVAYFNENFDTTTLGKLPVCWSSIIEGDNVSQDAYIATENFDTYANSSKAVQLFKFTSSANSEFILVTPQLNNLTTSNHKIKFFAHGNGVASIEVGTLNTNTIAATFTSFTNIELTASYKEYTVDFTANNITDTYVGIRLNTGTSVFIDNIQWLEITTCPDIVNLSVDKITSDTASILWESGGIESQWDVVYGIPSVENDPTKLTPITPAPNSDPKTTITGLTENTTYNVWVRSVCSGGEGNGTWIGPLTFTTECIGIPEFNENFDAVVAPNLPNCWTSILSGEDLAIDASVKTSTFHPYSENNSVDLYTSYSGDHATIMLVSPNLSTLKDANHRLRFYANSESEANLQVGTLDRFNSDATFTKHGQVLGMTKEYKEYILDFSDYYGEDTHIGFENVSYDTHTTISIDNIRWELIPVCADVFNLSLTEITSSSANVKWLASGSETNWQVAYGEVTVNDPSTIISDLLSEPTYPISGLTENTSYKVWVRSVCDAGEGNWIETSFKTLPLCYAITSFYEKFDTTPNGQLPDCWSAVLSGTTLDKDAYIYVVDYNGFSGKNSVRINNYTSKPTDNIILVTPELSDLSSKTGILKFYAKADYAATLIIGTLNGNDSNASFTSYGQEIVLTAIYKQFTIDFKNYSGSDTYIGFKNASLESYSPVNLDNIRWEANLKTNEFDKSNFNYYPNPVKNVLNLSYIQKINNVTVFNLIGQKVIENKIDATSVQLDLSSLSKGTYMVKVASGDLINTFKIVKE